MGIVYEDERLCLTEEQLQGRGYYLQKRNRRSKTDYWVSGDSDNVLAIVHSKIAHGDNALVVSKELCEKIGWPSICLREKGGGILTPYVYYGGRCVDLHVLLMPDLPEGMQIDHILHNRMFILPEAVRSCTAIENGYNRKDRKIKCRGDGNAYYFRSRVSTAKAVDVLEKKGCSIKKIGMCKDGTPRYDVESPRYGSEGECQKGIDLFEGYVYGDFRYRAENDFSESMDLLIRGYILGEFTTMEEMVGENRKRLSAVVAA